MYAYPTVACGNELSMYALDTWFVDRRPHKDKCETYIHKQTLLP